MSVDSDIVYGSMRIDETFEYKWQDKKRSDC